jgi:hypothetical protein
MDDDPMKEQRQAFSCRCLQLHVLGVKKKWWQILKLTSLVH